MPESAPCPSMHCDQGPCRIPSEFIVAAHADAKAKQEARMAEEMQGLTGGLPLPPGLKLF